MNVRQNILSKQIRCASSNNLKIIEKRLPKSKVELSVTVPVSFSKKCYQRYIKKCQEVSSIPGFRKGQEVPISLLIQSQGGNEAFNGNIISAIIEESSNIALKKWEGKAIAESDRMESDVKLLLKEFNIENPLSYKISFDILSDIHWTSSYKNIKVEVKSNGNEEKDEEIVEKYIRNMRKKEGKQRIVHKRGLEKGDVAILDIKFYNMDKSECFDGMTQNKNVFDTDVPDLLGMMENLKGLKIGDEKEFKVKFPNNWEPSLYRGLEAMVEVKIRELFEWDLPDLSDDFVKRFGRIDLKTVSDLKLFMLDVENKRRMEDMKNRIQDALIEELVKIVEMDVSESAIVESGKIQYQSMLLQHHSHGKLNKEALEQFATEELLMNYIDTKRKEIENALKGASAMEFIFKDLRLIVSDEELKEEINKTINDFKKINQTYDEIKLKEMAYEILCNEKVVDWYMNNGNVTILPYNKSLS